MSGQGRPSRWLVSPKDAGGLPAGQYFAPAQGFQGGYALVTPLAVEAMEIK
ncbi:hypothetical protein [Yersinia kristensenii]|uniref:hypothetical protein n=1 Tax=Yersinia kristensenii TaxID=28152 RepID=UPI0001A54AF8|nr:hypothetical protein [Yersinia kristensenii]EEP92414.1 hypothetical protein ykris0001_3490 [Yersinia kristensenii ATCC 33638]